MKSTFFGFLFILVSTIACSGGRNSANRAGFCFNNEESGKYDPLTLDYKNDNFRKAVFNLKAPNDLNPQEPVANEEEVVNFTLPTSLCA